MDGALVGEIADGNTYRSVNNTVLPIHGGKPMTVPRTVTLCSRFDNKPGRSYDGLFAYLGEPGPDSGIFPLRRAESK